MNESRHEWVISVLKKISVVSMCVLFVYVSSFLGIVLTAIFYQTIAWQYVASGAFVYLIERYMIHLLITYNFDIDSELDILDGK